ncbi:hypothetical protein BDV25DRAFT_38974 [Aspergillus avenaceus]|uniref:Uncharacterized protein n=1 Tax=Aspergillus avenaceus TaxID=36643 RepID=A0A5N6U3R6_ASPAV|nr:hypothetical protein BDV25DRAFT_38974 [Aspergillus avenaceus]
MTLRKLRKAIQHLVLDSEDDKIGYKLKTTVFLGQISREIRKLDTAVLDQIQLECHHIKVEAFSPHKESTDKPLFFRPMSTSELAAHPLDYSKPSVPEFIDKFHRLVEKPHWPVEYRSEESIRRAFAGEFAYYIDAFFSAKRVDVKNNLKRAARWYERQTHGVLFSDSFFIHGDNIANCRFEEVWEHWEDGDWPHVMIKLFHTVDADDRLLRGEVRCILEAMRYRLTLPKLKDHCIIPVQVISIAHKHGRILQAHWNGQDVIIRQSPLYDLNTTDMAIYDTFVRYMANKPIGDTVSIPRATV